MTPSSTLPPGLFCLSSVLPSGSTPHDAAALGQLLQWLGSSDKTFMQECLPKITNLMPLEQWLALVVVVGNKEWWEVMRDTHHIDLNDAVLVRDFVPMTLWVDVAKTDDGTLTKRMMDWGADPNKNVAGRLTDTSKPVLLWALSALNPEVVAVLEPITTTFTPDQATRATQEVWSEVDEMLNREKSGAEDLASILGMLATSPRQLLANPWTTPQKHSWKDVPFYPLSVGTELLTITCHLIGQDPSSPLGQTLEQWLSSTLPQDPIERCNILMAWFKECNIHFKISSQRWSFPAWALEHLSADQVMDLWDAILVNKMKQYTSSSSRLPTNDDDLTKKLVVAAQRLFLGIIETSPRPPTSRPRSLAGMLADLPSDKLLALSSIGCASLKRWWLGAQSEQDAQWCQELETILVSPPGMFKDQQKQLALLAAWKDNVMLTNNIVPPVMTAPTRKM